MTRHSSLLINERPLVVQPSLVRAIGLARALIVQQLHWRLENEVSREIDGHRFISDSYSQWAETVFPFWTPETIRKYFVDLEKNGLVISIQPDQFDRTKSYRLNHDKLRTYELLVHAFPQAEILPNRSGNTDRFNAVQVSASDAEDHTASLKDKNLKSLNKTNTENPQPAPKAGGISAKSRQIEEVFEFWKETTGHNKSKLDTKRRRLIDARLTDGFTVEELKAAVAGNKASKFHQGENDRATVYDGIGVIFRDAEHVEQFIALKANGARPIKKFAH